MRKKKLLELTCSVCRHKVKEQYTSKYKDNTMFWCDSCGARAYSKMGVEHSFIDDFVMSDCEKCKLSDLNTIALFCPHADDCLENKCCHYPCWCDLVWSSDEFDDVDLCRKKQMPFRETVMHLLLAILRTLRHK